MIKKQFLSFLSLFLGFSCTTKKHDDANTVTDGEQKNEKVNYQGKKVRGLYDRKGYR